MEARHDIENQAPSIRPSKWVRPRFGLRSVFVIVLILCVVFTWLGYKLRSASEQRSCVAKFEGNGVYATYEWGNVISLQPYGRVSDDDLVHLRGLPYLDMLFLQDTQVGDAGLSHLIHLSRLKWLVLSDRQITDSGLAKLKVLSDLRNLYLDGTLITDDGLKHLAEMTNLEYLSLRGTHVSDEGVRKLRRAMPNTEINY